MPPPAIQLYALLLYKTLPKETIQLHGKYNLGSFPILYRPSMREHIVFHGRLIAARTQPGEQQAVDFSQEIGRAYAIKRVDHPICAVLLTSANYPSRVAVRCLNTAISHFLSHCEAEFGRATSDLPDSLWSKHSTAILAEFSNPVEADQLLKVQKDLDDVKDVMLKNLDDLLQRGEKLENLMSKSQDLSNISREFYKQAKKNNQCCSWY